MNNILMITPYLPYPPVSGGRSRTFNLIKRLVQHYQITLVCFGRPEEQAFDLTPLRDLCTVIVVDRAPSPGKVKAALLSLSSIKPITMRLYTTPEMRATIQKLLGENHYDLIHVESFYMVQNVPHENKIPVLLTEPSIEFVAWQRYARVALPIYQRPALALEALKMRVFEPQTWTQSALVGVMSAVDAQLVKQAAPKIATVLTPNGVDVTYFTPGSAQREADSAIYMGDYKYFPNTDAMIYFAGEILPLIHYKRPNFSLTLLGKEPPTELMALGDDPKSGIKVAGLVDDTRPYLNRAGVFICPQRSGGGTRFKLLEAMACGCPIVSTSLGAEGLIAPGENHMLIADTPQAFADAVIAVLTDRDLAARLSAAGRDWVVKNHSWESSVALMMTAYNQLIER